MCVISCILKAVISVVNILLMVIGILLVVFGGLLLWGMNALMKLIYDLQTEIQKLLKELHLNTDATGVFSLIQQNSSTIGAIGFAVGLVLIAVAILGIIAVCCCSLKRILIMICVFLILFTVGLIILIAYFGVNTSDKVMIPLLNVIQKDLINKYQSINSTQPQSILINLVQISASCCGLYNYTDFNTATNFNRKAFDSNNKEYTLAFPLSCCDYKHDFTISKDDNDKCIQTSTSKNMNNGCWLKLKPEFEKYLSYCFTAIGITIAVLVASIIVTIILIVCVDKLD